MRQRRWMEYLKNFDYTISYNSGKANVVVDALSQKSSEIVASMMIKEWEMIKDFSHLTVSARLKSINRYLVSLIIQPNITDQIRSALPIDTRRNLWIDEND